MSVTLIRVEEGNNTTLSHLYIDSLFICYLLEDPIRAIKIPGQTCIPEGRYPLKLNTSAAMNASYKRRYPFMHRGMIEIDRIPGFDLVFFHIGNFARDTAGCPLPGFYWNKMQGEYQMVQSAFAYQMLYPRLLEKLVQDGPELVVRNQLRQAF